MRIKFFYSKLVTKSSYDTNWIGVKLQFKLSLVILGENGYNIIRQVNIWARSSVVERFPDKKEVHSSILCAPTLRWLNEVVILKRWRG